MIFINSPLSQFEVTNLIEIFALIFSQINIIHYNLAVFTSYICDFFSFFSQLTTFKLQNLLIFSYLPLDSLVFSLIFSCLGVLTVTIPLVLLSGIAGKILDTAAKVVVIVAGSSYLYKNHGGGSSSSGDDSDKDKDKETTNEDKKDNDTKTKTNDSNSDSDTASK